MPRLPPLPIILAADAASCLGLGIALVVGAMPLAGLSGLPLAILHHAGLLLLAAALVIAAVALRPINLGVAAVIAGNVAWIVASLAVLALAPANALGIATIAVQASAVALITLAEWLAWRRAPALAA